MSAPHHRPGVTTGDGWHLRAVAGAGRWIDFDGDVPVAAGETSLDDFGEGGSRTNSRKNGTAQCPIFAVDGRRTALMWNASPMPHPTIDHRGQKKMSGVRSHHNTT